MRSYVHNLFLVHIRQEYIFFFDVFTFISKFWIHELTSGCMNDEVCESWFIEPCLCSVYLPFISISVYVWKTLAGIFMNTLNNSKQCSRIPGIYQRRKNAERARDSFRILLCSSVHIKAKYWHQPMGTRTNMNSFFL